VNAVEMDSFRRSARRSRLEKIINTVTRRIIEVEETITGVIEKKTIELVRAFV
jgi:hypothetical protein